MYLDLHAPFFITSLSLVLLSSMLLQYTVRIYHRATYHSCTFFRQNRTDNLTTLTASYMFNIRVKEPSHLQNKDGRIRHLTSVNQSDERNEGINECMPIAQWRTCSFRLFVGASDQGPFLKELACGCIKGPLTKEITSLEGLVWKQTTCTRFEQICTLYSSVCKFQQKRCVASICFHQDKIP